MPSNVSDGLAHNNVTEASISTPRYASVNAYQEAKPARRKIVQQLRGDTTAVLVLISGITTIAALFSPILPTVYAS